MFFPSESERKDRRAHIWASLLSPPFPASSSFPPFPFVARGRGPHHRERAVNDDRWLANGASIHPFFPFFFFFHSFPFFRRNGYLEMIRTSSSFFSRALFSPPSPRVAIAGCVQGQSSVVAGCISLPEPLSRCRHGRKTRPGLPTAFLSFFVTSPPFFPFSPLGPRAFAARWMRAKSQVSLFLSSFFLPRLFLFSFPLSRYVISREAVAETLRTASRSRRGSCRRTFFLPLFFFFFSLFRKFPFFSGASVLIDKQDMHSYSPPFFLTIFFLFSHEACGGEDAPMDVR